MTIKTNEIKSETIQEAIREIEEKYGITGDKAEAIASHIVYTDEDWTDDEPEEEMETEKAKALRIIRNNEVYTDAYCEMLDNDIDDYQAGVYWDMFEDQCGRDL